MDGASAKIQHAINELVNDVDKSCLRKKQVQNSTL